MNKSMKKIRVTLDGTVLVYQHDIANHNQMVWYAVAGSLEEYFANQREEMARPSRIGNIEPLF